MMHKSSGIFPFVLIMQLLHQMEYFTPRNHRILQLQELERDDTEYKFDSTRQHWI